MKPDSCPASSFHLSSLWSASVWIWLALWKPGATRCWPAGQDVPAGLAAAASCQTAWRAAEFSLMKWSINGVFLLCPAVDFHNACGTWYLWNISSAKVVRISLWVQNYWNRIWQTEILFASFLQETKLKTLLLPKCFFPYPLGYWQTEKHFIVLMRSRDSLPLLLRWGKYLLNPFLYH